MDPAVLERALTRERKRRAAAEALLEEKSRELYHSYRDLEQAHKELQDNKDHLVHSEKMASLGVLSAGIAHEINNPIGYVLSNLNNLNEYVPVYEQLVQMCRQMAEKATGMEALGADARSVLELMQKEDVDFIVEDTRDLLTETADGLSRVKEIVQGLQTFSHTGGGTHHPVEVNAVLQNTLRIAANQLKNVCEVVEDLADVPEVHGNAGRLGQVLMNLIVNASQAVTPGQGIIEVSTRACGDSVEVCVADNGCGIASDDVDKIFEPFFTTKDVGSGTGLGLSISLGIVKDHKGELTCESTPGRGTCFTLKLPTSASA